MRSLDQYSPVVRKLLCLPIDLANEFDIPQRLTISINSDLSRVLEHTLLIANYGHSGTQGTQT